MEKPGTSIHADGPGYRNPGGNRGVSMSDDLPESESDRIRDVLREHPMGMNIKEIANAVSMSRNSVAKYLDVLTASGQLGVRQMGNAKVYYISRRVPLRNILNHSHELIVLLDRDLRITQASDSFAAFTGKAREDLIGTKLSRLMLPILSDKDESDLIPLLDGGPTLVKEVKILKGGTEFFFNARFLPTFFDDGGPGIALLLEDISDRKQAEQALRENERLIHLIFQSTPVPKFLIDRNHKTVFWNRALEILTRIKEEEVIGTNRHWRAFYTEERPCLSDLLLDNKTELLETIYFGKCRKTSHIDSAYECIDFFPALGPDGRWLRITAALLRDSHGNLIGAMETLEDITELKKKELRIDEKQDTDL